MSKPIGGGPQEAESNLRDSEANLRLLVDSIRDYAIFILDPRGHVSTWNTGAQRLKGYAASEIIGRHFSTFYPADDIAAGKCELELRVATEVGRFEEEGWRLRKDGSRFWANVVISPIRDGNQRLVGFAKVTRDLTERRRAEEERAQLVAAEQTNRTKDEFIAMLSHELRNPLSPIVTALQLLKVRQGTEGERERLIIERQVQHLVRLVDDLLDVSRIAQGKLDLRKATVEVGDVIAAALDTVSALVEQRRHRLSVSLPHRSLTVFGDAVRLSQVVANLLTNAAKYTEVGGVIELRAEQRGEDIEITVTDNGTGIAAELLARIFDPFVQAPRPADRAAGGLGIGLTLVRSLVQLHGGSVKAYSEGSGRGSSFSILLPAHETGLAKTDQRSSGAAASSAARSVLVVDDNADAADLLAELLRTRGHDVRIAHDGNEALKIVESFTPDAAILDIGLPGMDGYELARRFVDRFDSGCRLIALTGYGRAEDRHKSRAAGFNVHLVKPVDPSELLRLVEAAPGAV